MFQKFTNSIRNKLIIFFIINLILFSIHSGILINNLSNLENNDKLINYSGKNRMYAERIVKTVYSLYLNPNDEKIFQNLTQLISIYDERLLNLRYGNNQEEIREGQKFISVIKSEVLISKWNQLHLTWLDLKNFLVKIDSNLDINNNSGGLTKNLLVNIEKKYSILIIELDEFVNLMEVELIQSERFIVYSLIFAPIFGLVLIVIIILLISKNITNPLEELRKNFDLMSKKDSEYNINPSFDKRNDEIGSLYKSFMELAKYLQEAQEAYKIKTNFLAKINHEIRTPLLVICGIIENLDPQDDKTFNLAFDQFKMLNNASQNLLNLINDILDLAKLEANQIYLVKQDFIIENLIREVYQQHQSFAQKKNLKFTLDFDKQIPKILINDLMRVKQILNNLLSNALKYTFEGEVLFKVSMSYSGINSVKLQFIIQDTGIGIPEGENIFEMFYQGSNRINYNIEGTGLGLSICKNLVEQLQGTINFESKVNSGTRFLVELPFTVSTQDENMIINKDLEIHKELELLKGNILYVDDFEDSHAILKLYLKQSKLNIDCFSNGFDALDLLTNTELEYDVFLLDLRMPNMDGFELIKNIEKILEKKGMAKKPFIALTAFSGEEEIQKALHSGFDNVIIKPFNKEILLAVLSIYL